MAAASVAKFTPPLYACPKPHTPPLCHHAPGRRHCPAEDLLLKHTKPRHRQSKLPPHPKSYVENRTPAQEGSALPILAGPAPRAELIGATGRAALSLAVSSSWRHISYFGSGRRERSRDRPAAVLRSLPGSLGRAQEGQSRDQHPGMLQHTGSPARGRCEILGCGFKANKS